jgi:pimeloyl-ACP methyl ester carboxylesterase
MGGATAVRSQPTSPSASLGNVGHLFTGVRAAALNMLNFVTYYQMKERAGIVGRKGVHKLLREIRQQRPDLKLHLIGHSFGGRLVTAAVDGPANQEAVKVDSMTLLQAAFSHTGFAKKFDGTKDGLFRRVITEHRVEGPILITYTNDTAVGLAYPIASRIAGQIASGLGDKNDQFGGIGRNGAQKTPEASDGRLFAVGADYEFKAGQVYNLSADEFIENHSDIVKPAIAYAVLSAVATT